MGRQDLAARRRKGTLIVGGAATIVLLLIGLYEIAEFFAGWRGKATVTAMVALIVWGVVVEIVLLRKEQ